ncbi:MAG: hypothetical protein COB61_005715 [Thiotrichales bacterium]|nr:hypothetical protein [Thiotrichales bacterium]
MDDFKIKILKDGFHFDYEISFEKTDSFTQRVLLTLNTWKNEFAYDTEKGIDYHHVLSNKIPARALESFFLSSLKKQLSDFDTFDNYTLDYDKTEQTAHISFRAYSTTGEVVEIKNFEI